MVPVPHFLDWGVPCTGVPFSFWIGTFQDKKVKSLQSPAVHIGDLLRLNYNKTVFGRGSAPHFTRTAQQSPRLHPPLLSSWDQRAPRSHSELVPTLFRSKLLPWWRQSIELDSRCPSGLRVMVQRRTWTVLGDAVEAQGRILNWATSVYSPTFIKSGRNYFYLYIRNSAHLVISIWKSHVFSLPKSLV